MRTMEDKLNEELNRDIIEQVCNEISRKSSFLHVFSEELTEEDLQMLKNVNHRLSVVYKTVYRRMHNESEKE